MGAASREWTEGIAEKCAGTSCTECVDSSNAGAKLLEWRENGREGCRISPHNERGGQTSAGEGKLYRHTRIAETRQFVAREREFTAEVPLTDYSDRESRKR